MVFRPALVIDCAEIGKSKNDAALISALADQTGKSISIWGTRYECCS